MAARLALRRISFLNFTSSSTSSTLRPLASTAFPFRSDATRDATAEAAADAPQPAPGLSPANVATLDDVTVSASIIETGDVLLSRPRVANLPEDLSPEVLEEVNRIPSPPEKVKPVIPFPTLAKVQRNTRQEPKLLADAIRLVKANAKAGFTETVEAHVRLGIDPKRSDQMVRGAATLPNGSGKVVRVAVFAEGNEAQEALAAGADVVGADDLVDRVKNSGGKLDFDKCIATPSFMPRLGKVARILGPRGLMPNPKVPPPPCLGHPIFFPVFESKRSMYTDVAAARVGRRPDGVSESHVDALDGIEEMAAGAGSTAKMSIVLKSFEKIHPGRLASVSKVGLPTTRILFTFNRSPHVDKKARDQFEMKTRKHLLVMAMDVGKLREKYNQLKNHNMLGVQLKVNFHYKTRLDMSRIQGHVPDPGPCPGSRAMSLVGQGSVAA